MVNNDVLASLFDLFLYIPVNNFSVMWGWVFLGWTSTKQGFVCLIPFFTSQSTIFQLCRDGSSWVEPVLSQDKCVLLKDTTQWRQWGNTVAPGEARTHGPSALSQALNHWATVLPMT